MRLMLDSYRDLLFALALSIVSIFLILVAYYQSFTLPIIAMSAIPLGLVGIFPGHWLLGKAFSVTSLVGIIALTGVLVRSSLLIIDFVLDYRRQGMGLREAILEAGAVRLRPILLTDPGHRFRKHDNAHRPSVLRLGHFTDLRYGGLHGTDPDRHSRSPFPALQERAGGIGGTGNDGEG